MCYQCSGCGRCLEGQGDLSAKPRCPCCRREVDPAVRYCPSCGAFIRPKAGSVKANRKQGGNGDS